MTSGLKFIPIAVAMFIGYVVIASGSEETRAAVTQTATVGFESFNLTRFIPFFGVMGSMAAIFFAYDGFYFATAVTQNLRKPNHAP